MTPKEVGASVGRAIARDVIAERMPREWTGLDPQDGDVIAAAGYAPDSPEWGEAESAAENEYRRVIASAR